MVKTSESPKRVLIDSGNICADIPLETEKTKPENVGSKERGEILSPEESNADVNRTEITPEDISLNSSTSYDQTEKNPVPRVMTTNSETRSLETAQQKPVEEPVLSCGEGEGTDSSMSAAIDSLTSATSSMNLGHDDKSSTSDASRSRVDSLGGVDASVMESGM